MASRFLMQFNPSIFPEKLFRRFPFSQSSDKRTFERMVFLNVSS